MEKLPFDKIKLLENLEIHTHRPRRGIFVKLINNNVSIFIIIQPNYVWLEHFYKQPGVEKGMLRCSLYVLLEKLLKDGYVNDHKIIKVSSPTPEDGNMERLIKIYTKIGFTRGEPEPGNPINLYSTCKNLVNTLKVQCEISNVRKRKKSRKLKKKKEKERWRGWEKRERRMKKQMKDKTKRTNTYARINEEGCVIMGGRKTRRKKRRRKTRKKRRKSKKKRRRRR